jgi:predicted ATPase with chaperone activity
LRTENILLREEWSKHYGFPRIIGESEAIKRAVSETQRVAQTDATVLLLGESGTGKELFARAVHHLSPRREKPFVAINCAAIPETLIENELFGHERGAFTGAGDRRQGKFELAATGTVFLDEIGELPWRCRENSCGPLKRSASIGSVDEARCRSTCVSWRRRTKSCAPPSMPANSAAIYFSGWPSFPSTSRHCATAATT